MSATWTVLGSGNHEPSADRGSPGHLVHAGGTLILADCGAGSFHGIAKAGHDVRNLDAVCITHLHPDHIADLVPLLFRLRILAKWEGERALSIFGPPGTVEYVNEVRSLHAPFLDHQQFNVTVEEGGDLRAVLPGVTISSAPAAHGLPANAFGFAFDDGSRAVYSGDTGRSAELVRFASHAELLVIEASNPNERETPFHLSPAGATEIATKAGAEAMILVHLGPEMDEIDIPAQCGDSYRGIMMVGSDQLVFEVRGSGSNG